MSTTPEVLELQVAIQAAIDEDWELIKDTAGKFADRRSMFNMAYRFGWHAASKHYGVYEKYQSGKNVQS